MVTARQAAGLFLSVLLVVALAAQAAPVAAVDGQWALDVVGAKAAWRTTRGSGITVAVVDAGVDGSVADLAPRIKASVTCVGAQGDPARCRTGGSPEGDHGTAVAGILAATAGKGGIDGVAPEVDLLSVQVLGGCLVDVAAGAVCRASGDGRDIEAGIRWAVDNGAKVVNASLGSGLAGVPLPAVERGARYAWSRGAIVVASAGNEGALLGAGYDTTPVVVVTATDRADRRPPYASGVGPAVWGLTAPGGAGPSAACPAADVLTVTASGARCFWGTSFAAPMVSGGLALLLAAGLAPEQAIGTLLASAKDLGNPGKDAVFGHGRLDIGAAMAGARTPVAAPPVPPPTTTAAPTPVPAAARSGAAPPSTPAPLTTAPAAPAAGPAAEAGDLPVAVAPAVPSRASRPLSRGEARPWLLLAVAAALLLGAGARIAAAGRRRGHQ